MKLHIRILLMLAAICGPIQLHAQKQDFKNFYGIAWRGKPHENLRYARNMGYKYVFYQNGMEFDSLSDSLYFYLESPEYTIYKRTIDTNTPYSAEDIKFYESHCVKKDNNYSFPHNMASGWFFSEARFSVELDFRNVQTVDWAVEQILKKVGEIESKNSKFKFAGFAWDVPQLSGDFWSDSRLKGGKQVKLSYWNAGEFAFAEGRATFYNKLLSRSKAIYPNTKFIIEPNKIYEDWIYDAIHSKTLKVSPDMICQESADLTILDDSRIASAGVKHNQLAITSPSVFSEDKNRSIAAQMAMVGGWFSWFGRFGGTGDMPNYKSITEVPARLKLIRAVVNWENVNRTPLNQRTLESGNYSSPTAYISRDLIWSRSIKEKQIFAVFNSITSFVPLSDSKNVTIYLLDELMTKGKQSNDIFKISDNKVYLADTLYFDKAFLIEGN